MRRLAQPEVLKSAAIAALLTALLCYPRFSFWLHRSDPIWYLEAILFLGTTLLWGFVFAWHTRYSQCPVFTVKWDARLCLGATLGAVVVAVLLHSFLDPSLRLTTPEDYPTSLKQWLAMTLFHLAFVQLFLIFAPFAWLIRLFQDRRMATVLTVFLGAVVLGLKIQSTPAPLSTLLFAELLILRVFLGFVLVSLYLRGGVLLVWWWSFLVEARHLLDLIQ